MTAPGPVAISGASGMLGAPLARRCLADGAEVHVLTRSAFPPLRLAALAPAVRIHRVDWDDRRELTSVLEAIAPRTVFHLAGGRFRCTSADARDDVRSTIGITAALLDAVRALPAAAVVFASSGAVYGGNIAAPEAVPLEPLSWLGAAKAMAEQLLAGEARMSGRPLVTLRLFTPFGPDDDPDRLIVSALRAVFDRTPLALTAGSQTRDYLYIDDAVDAFVAAACLRPSEPAVFNIGSGRARSVRAVVEFIAERFGRPHLARFGTRPGRPGEIEAMQADIGLAGQRLGWSPRVAFAEGVDRTAAALSATSRETIGRRARERVST